MEDEESEWNCKNPIFNFHNAQGVDIGEHSRKLETKILEFIVSGNQDEYYTNYFKVYINHEFAQRNLNQSEPENEIISQFPQLSPPVFDQSSGEYSPAPKKINYNQVWWTTLLLLSNISQFTISNTISQGLLQNSLEKFAENACAIRILLLKNIANFGASITNTPTTEQSYCILIRQFIFICLLLLIFPVIEYMKSLDDTNALIKDIKGYSLLVSCIHLLLIKFGVGKPEGKGTFLKNRIQKYYNMYSVYLTIFEQSLLNPESFFQPGQESIYMELLQKNEEKNQLISLYIGIIESIDKYETDVIKIPDGRLSKPLHFLTPDEVNQYFLELLNYQDNFVDIVENESIIIDKGYKTMGLYDNNLLEYLNYIRSGANTFSGLSANDTSKMLNGGKIKRNTRKKKTKRKRRTRKKKKTKGKRKNTRRK